MASSHIKKWQEVIGVAPDGDFGPVTLEASLRLAEKVHGKPVEVIKPVVPGENPYSMLVNRLRKHGDFVSWKATPNLSPGTITPRLVVIHFTATNSDQSALNWLTQKGSGVSCHFLITKTGVVWQMAETNRRAWHAGASYYAGRGFQWQDINSVSVGIENTGTGSDWPEAQIIANIQVCRALIEANRNIIDIVGHDFVATPAGRKSDPGKLYPWDRVLKECGLE
jgi:N-acetyl-anhydromuramyl-L-alanine amidase AmpD